MADEEKNGKKPEGEGEKPEGEGEKLEPETFTREYVHQLREEAKQVRTKYRTLLEEREAEARKQQDAAAAELAEKGKFKELYDKLKAEHDRVLPEIEKYRTADKARREALLAKLPEEKRGIYQSVDTEVLADVVETLSKPDPTKGMKPGGGRDKSWETMTAEERQELIASNRTLAIALYNEYYKKLNGRTPPSTPF